jgi:GTP-binding protein
MFIPVPLGTELIDTDTGELVADITVHGEKTLVARGGRGGRGNARFVSSTHQAPREFDTGGPVQSIRLRLSLKVIADVGIIGYPNAGKSTLISKISHARPKIADYPFTTLSPNLGVVRLPDDRTFVVADIPGIIEGASDGVGLGLRFLKHVERTKVLIHLLDLDPTNGRDPRSDYEKLNRELLSFSAPLSQKQQVVAANKVDFPGADERLRELAQYLPIDFFPISAMVGTGVRELLEEVYRLLSLYREHDGSD